MDAPPDPSRPVVVEHVATPLGEWVLRRHGEEFEVIANGTFLMDTRNGESERALVSVALGAAGTAGTARTVLIGGLGVGFSVEAALDAPGVEAVTVVEISPDVVRWNRVHFAGRMAARLADPRLSLVCGDLFDYLASLRLLAGRLDADGALAVWSHGKHARLSRSLARHFRTVAAVEVPVARGEADVVYVAGPPLRHG
jgi:hypothetical protein